MVGGGSVAGDRDVGRHGRPEQGPYVRFVRLSGQWIPEEHQQVHLALGDPRADLLVAAVRAAVQTDHVEPDLVGVRVGRSSR